MILRLLLVLAAAASALGQFLQERHRLKLLGQLPGRQARDTYEKIRARDGRFMLVFTLVLVAVAVTALIVVATRGSATHASALPLRG